MNLDERILLLETLIEAVIWGPHMDNPEHRRQIAQHLYRVAEAGERHQSFPPTVLHALNQCADGLSGIDNIPDALKPALRHPQSPDGTRET